MSKSIERKRIQLFHKTTTFEALHTGMDFFFVKRIMTLGIRGTILKLKGLRILGTYCADGRIYIVPELPLKRIIRTIIHEYLHKTISSDLFRKEEWIIAKLGY